MQATEAVELNQSFGPECVWDWDHEENALSSSWPRYVSQFLMSMLVLVSPLRGGGGGVVVEASLKVSCHARVGRGGGGGGAAL